MHEKQQRYGTYFLLTLGCFAISAVALALIPFLQFLKESGQSVFRIIIAAAFWAGLLVGIFSTFITNAGMSGARRRVYKAGKLEKSKLPGIVSFSIRPLSVITYAVFFCGAALAVSEIITHWLPEFVLFPILGITLFAFAFHCVIDGKNYKVYRIIKEGMHDDNGKN